MTLVTRIRRLGARSSAGMAIVAMLGLSCHRAPPQQPPEAPAPDPAPTPFHCGSGDETFSDDAWFARDALAIAHIELADPQALPALSHLAASLAGTENEASIHLPIDLKFIARQWSWEVPLVRGVITHIGSTPAQLRFARLDHDTRGWLWPLGCSPLELVEHAVEVSPLQLRPALGATTLTSRDPSQFPYDLLVLSGGQAALVPAGSAERFVERWRDGAPAGQQLGVRSEPLIDLLRKTPDAPVRLVARAWGLVASELGEQRQGPIRLRITADALVPVTDDEARSVGVKDGAEAQGNTGER